MAPGRWPCVRDGLVTTLVWFSWSAMAAADGWLITRAGPTVPFSDEWELVPVFAGREPVTPAWLWSLHNEHRLPLTRLILVALFRLTGSFHAGMWLNLGLLAALAALMIGAARTVRGRSSLLDVFFPLALLHFGHWENLLWNWQLGFVLAVTLTGGVLWVVVCRGNSLNGPAVVSAGISLAFLPLCGGNGLVVGIPLVVWLAGCGFAGLVQTQKTRTGLLALGFAGAAGIVMGAYLFGYARPAQHAYVVRADVAIQAIRVLLELGFGLSIEPYWPLGARGAVLLYAAALVLLVGVAISDASERRRATGLLAVLAGVVLMGLALGLGRSVSPEAPRYLTLSSPGVLACFWAFLLYGRRPWARFVGAGVLLLLAGQAWPASAISVLLTSGAVLLILYGSGVAWGESLLLVLAMVMLYPNTMLGLHYGFERKSIASAFVADARSGSSLDELADHYSRSPSILFPDRARLLSYLQAMQQARIGPFQGAPRSSTSGLAPRQIADIGHTPR